MNTHPTGDAVASNLQSGARVALFGMIVNFISAAAFIGISAALIGGRGWESADDWAALFACGVIAANGVRLLRPALSEIMDTAPRGEIVDRVRNAAGAVPGVIEVEKCFVRKMG